MVGNKTLWRDISYNNFTALSKIALNYYLIYRLVKFSAYLLIISRENLPNYTTCRKIKQV